MARGLKFRIKKVQGFYYPCSENKGADQLIYVFVFEYTKIRFSHDAAQLWKRMEIGYLFEALKYLPMLHSDGTSPKKPVCIENNPNFQTCLVFGYQKLVSHLFNKYVI